jgi:hypothetical protein
VQPTDQQLVPVTLAELVAYGGTPFPVDLPDGYDAIIQSVSGITEGGDSDPIQLLIFDSTGVWPLWTQEFDGTTARNLNWQDIYAPVSGGSFNIQFQGSAMELVVAGWLLGPTSATVTVTLE